MCAQKSYGTLIITRLNFMIGQIRPKSLSSARTGRRVELKFTVNTSSIYIVANEYRATNNPIEGSEYAAELKDYLKTIP